MSSNSVVRSALSFTAILCLPAVLSANERWSDANSYYAPADIGYTQTDPVPTHPTRTQASLPASGNSSHASTQQRTAGIDASYASGNNAGAPACDDCKKPDCGDCKKQKALGKAVAGAYKGLFYDNNFDYLCDPCYQDHHLGENAKRIAVGEKWTWDLGGQYRLRQHGEYNLRQKSLTGVSDDYLLSRLRLYMNAEYGDWFRFYGEAIDATSWFQNRVPRGIEVNRFDALNLFADFKVWDNGNQLWIRPGRQELLYGAERVVSPLDWSNTRRTFDGAKAYWLGDNWRVDGWWTRPVRFGQHITNGLQDHNFDSPNQDEDFVGLWAKYKTKKGRALEAFFLRLDNYGGGNVNVNMNRGDFDYNMFGGRILNEAYGLLYEVWGGYQFGQWAGNDITAGQFTCGIGDEWNDVTWKPSLWFYYDWASGDHNLNDNKIATANQYFPLGHKYFGWMDLIARQNIQDVNAVLAVKPTKKLKLLLWYHMFYLQSRFDALYNAGGAPLYQDPTGGSGNQVGTELDFIAKWQFNPRTDILIGYSHFFAGNYFNSAAIQGGPAGLATNGANGKDADFVYTQWTVNF
ncbi:MAG: alginate export family protein [Pirellulales bacterium]